MLQNFFEHIINQTYQNFRILSIWFIRPLSTASSYLKFGGWEMSYNWKGITKTTKEIVGNAEIISKTIFFNQKYYLQLMGVDTGEEFSFPYLVRTIAHEIAHCLLIDHDPNYFYIADSHNEVHQLLTKQLEIYLWVTPEIKELANLQNNLKIL